MTLVPRFGIINWVETLYFHQAKSSIFFKKTLHVCFISSCDLFKLYYHLQIDVKVVFGETSFIVNKPKQCMCVFKFVRLTVNY